MQVTVVLATSL